MSEFTKFEWYIEEGFDKHYDQPTLNISRYGLVEFCTIWSGSNWISKENRATAQLIAHAPQMLEMLNTLVSDFDSCHNEIDVADAFECRIEGIKQLIKQATTI